ncbi:MAG: hypothetical protein HY644_03945 [Acidobacteria bacterium]|nr:hypothetical protein [Acidobacteriota bacterium]
MDLRSIQELMGHSSIEITIKRYARYQRDHAFGAAAIAQQQEAKWRAQE